MLEQPASHALVAPPRVTDRIPRTRPPLLIGLLAWLVPGLGHVAMGRYRKAVVMLAAIGGLFAWGLWLTGFTCVDPQQYRLEFVAQVFAGGPTLLAQHLTEDARVTELLPNFDVGRLYVDIAGLLNVVAISDALGLSLAHNARVTALRQLAWERAQPVEPPPLPVEAEASPEAAGDPPPTEHDVFPAFGWMDPEQDGDAEGDPS